jgi:2-polyprenylphenol hydroxylase and related flavodoxin oxidoreductases
MGVTALLVLLPWWPPKFRRSERREWQVVVHSNDGGPIQLGLREGETILEAGLREGLALPYECRNGGCGVCLCSVELGTVEHRPYQKSALPDASKAGGKALMCCAVATSDVVIEVEGLLRPADAEAQLHSGRVVGLERLADDVMRVLIAVPGGSAPAFRAGQYINIVTDDGQRRAFSFANPPHQPHPIELHVRRIPGGRFTGHVFDSMRVGDELKFEGPLGSFTLNEGTRPILFIAGATGFAPVKSILEDAFGRGVQRPMRLYWGVRQRKDLYLLELAQRWQREHANFQVVPVLSEPLPEDHWPARTGLVHEAMLADYDDLSGFEVYVCGSLKMVETAVPAFLAHGLQEEACFSDAFLPAAAPVANA